MKRFSWISRLFTRVPKSVTTVNQPPTVDLSLRPNPATYLDQNGESKKILERISSSSSSVVGIAGVRGAGKSSLALKVLGSCEGSGYFTLLIHSPTGYEPREFLLSVFQRVCEATITRLEKLFGLEQTIEARGKAALKRTRLFMAVILLGGFVILAVPILYSYYYYLNQRSAAMDADLRNRTSFLQHQLNDITNSQNLLDDYLSHPEKYKYLTKDRYVPSDQAQKLIDEFFDSWLRHSYLYDENLFHEEQSMADELPELMAQIAPSDLNRLSVVLRREATDLKERINRYQGYSTYSAGGNYFVRTTLPLTIGSLLLYVGAFVVVQTARTLRRRVNLQRKYPNESGLYELAKETLEHLKYQTTVTSSQDASINLWKLASKFARTKQLETRPVSLPGLTADCNLFINNVATVFGGKCVICLDELDKIGDPNQLEELLRGVKGILGQNKCHFLLTVSEDALARFSTRRRAERDIVESSFDDMISINRVSFAAARSMVTTMLNIDAAACSQTLDKNVLLVWMFGGAIPREIKRNVVTAQGFDFLNGNPTQLWTTLFTGLIDSLLAWGLVVSAEKDVSYDFLFCVENTRQLRADLQTSDPRAWLKSLVELWSTRYQLPFVFLPSQSESIADANAEILIESFERGVFELAIGAYSLLSISDETLIEEVHVSKLLEVFGLLAYSPSFAGFRFNGLLTAAGILKAPDTENLALSAA